MPAALRTNLLSGFNLGRDDLLVTTLNTPRLLTAFLLLHRAEPPPLTDSVDHIIAHGG